MNSSAWPPAMLDAWRAEQRAQEAIELERAAYKQARSVEERERARAQLAYTDGKKAAEINAEREVPIEVRPWGDDFLRGYDDQLRPEGCYWVELGGTWAIAEWAYGEWYFLGADVPSDRVDKVGPVIEQPAVLSSSAPQIS